MFKQTINESSANYFSAMRQTLLYLFILNSMSLRAFAQQEVTVMCYNVLNFPTGNIEGREDTLRHIINHVEPDLFLIQELKNDSGLQLILNESFADLTGNYEATTFVPQQSNPTSGFKLQQAMIYNEDLFGLASEGYLQTSVRDLNKFKLYYKDPALENGADTVFLYVFVMHLKSSQGSSNVASRLEMVQALTFHQQYLEAGASMIVAGDFNVYTSDEPAYQELLDPTNLIQLRDPINTPGDWNSSSFQPKSVLTQSTRASSIFGDGAGGGLDDRFDFILLSSDMFQPWNTIVYEEDSYYAMGNTGACYNQSITDCSGGEWTDEMLQSLYYMSDHLPVVLKLNLGVGSVSVDKNPDPLTKIWICDSQLNFNWHKKEDGFVSVVDMLGRSIFQKKTQLDAGSNRLDISSLSGSGILSVTVRTETNSLTVKVYP